MLSQAQTQAAADPLFRLWQEGRHLTALPQDLRPGTRAEGYAIQALLESRTAQPLFGWKIAATSREGQAHIRVDGPIAGRLLAERAVCWSPWPTQTSSGISPSASKSDISSMPSRNAA